MSKEDYLAQEAFKRLDAIGNKIVEVTPVIWDKMVLLTQAESIAYLVVGGICTLILGVILYWVKSNKIKFITGCEYSRNPTFAAFTVFPAFIILMIVAGVNLLYPWNWVGAFAPEARLIARLIGAVSGTNS